MPSRLPSNEPTNASLTPTSAAGQSVKAPRGSLGAQSVSVSAGGGDGEEGRPAMWSSERSGSKLAQAQKATGEQEGQQELRRSSGLGLGWFSSQRLSGGVEESRDRHAQRARSEGVAHHEAVASRHGEREAGSSRGGRQAPHRRQGSSKTADSRHRGLGKVTSFFSVASSVLSNLSGGQHLHSSRQNSTRSGQLPEIAADVLLWC
eukprot:488964-Rhodomonas_salina.1